MTDHRARLSPACLLQNAAQTGRPILMDGAMGTELSRRGVDTSSTLWSGLAPLTHSALLHQIHQEHVSAGAEVVITCTFRTTRRAFRAAYRPESEWRQAARQAVLCAADAADDRALVAGSIAPLEDCWRPDLAPSGKTSRAEHLLLATELVASGVDVLWLETFGSLGEIRAAAQAAVEAGAPHKVPFVASMTTTGDGSLLSGEPLEEAVVTLRELGTAALLLNCIPPWFVDRALSRLKACAGDTPIGVYASLARAEAGQSWQGDAFLSPDKYASLVAGWVRQGATLIGACCGSTTAHVAALRAQWD